MNDRVVAGSSLVEEDRAELLALARRSIRRGVEHGAPLEVDLASYPATLRCAKGCFVTLHLDGDLRGCVGSIRARGPLVAEIARVAFSAAFRDPRFPPVTARDCDRLDVHISVLSEPILLACESLDQLCAALRPNVDGVILTEGTRVGTFLPEVWAKFPDPRSFLDQLRRKAGLPSNFWSTTLRVERYTTEAF